MKRGRPSTGRRRDKRLHISLTVDEYDKLLALTTTLNKSKTDIIADAINDLYEELDLNQVLMDIYSDDYVDDLDDYSSDDEYFY